MDNNGNNNNNFNNMLNRRTSTFKRPEPKNIKQARINNKLNDDKRNAIANEKFLNENSPFDNNNSLENKHDRSRNKAFDSKEKLNKNDGFDNSSNTFENNKSDQIENQGNNVNNQSNEVSPQIGDANEFEQEVNPQIEGDIQDNNIPSQVNKNKRNKSSDNLFNKFKNNRAFDLNNKRNEDKNNNSNKDNKGNSNNQSNNPKNPNPKGRKKGNNTKSLNPKVAAAKKIANVGKNIAKARIAKRQAATEEEQKESAVNKAVQTVKKVARIKKIMSVIASIISVALPYILAAALVIGVILIVVVVLLSVFSFLLDKSNVEGNMQVNYCGSVVLSWVETDEWEAGEEKISSDEYLAYLIANSPYSIIDDDDAMNALAIVYRTNFYADAGNLDSDTCYYEIDHPYEGVGNEIIINAIKETDNKIFATAKDVLSELPVDEKFSYTRVDELDGKNVYRLYQDGLAYNKEWMDSNVGSDNLENRNAIDQYSFSPFAAFYLGKEKKLNYETILYHFLYPSGDESRIYEVQKIGGPGWGDGSGGFGSGYCSDIPLSSTPLSREEFIAAVEAKVSNPDFKNNAGRIYDLAIANNFNPELIIIRAQLEGGFKEQGGRYNYFGIRCYNGTSKCKDFSSMDEAVLEYIKIVKGYNYSSVFDVMKKYSYLGDYWFNPGGSGLGGCYYLPYISKYMSEEAVVNATNACASGKTCTKNGGGDCTPTTQEDRDAYTKWQVEKMVERRQGIFNIGAQTCDPIEYYTGDPSGLGEAVVRYAKANFNGAIYTQDTSLRMQAGYADCSSLVYRSYLHFGINVGSSTEAIYLWCKNNNRMISPNNLSAGDLILYNHGTYANSAHVDNVGHVSLYVGPGRQFGAHGKGKPANESAYHNNGDFFCRPS